MIKILHLYSQYTFLEIIFQDVNIKLIFLEGSFQDLEDYFQALEGTVHAFEGYQNLWKVISKLWKGLL